MTNPGCSWCPELDACVFSAASEYCIVKIFTCPVSRKSMSFFYLYFVYSKLFIIHNFSENTEYFEDMYIGLGVGLFLLVVLGIYLVAARRRYPQIFVRIYIYKTRLLLKLIILLLCVDMHTLKRRE